MEFYIGGYAQGKLEYVLRIHNGEKLEVIDGGFATNLESFAANLESCTENRVILNHLHLWVKGQMEREKNSVQQIEEFIRKHENCIIISDEIGNGIVPIEQKERDYRECLGRIQIKLAAEAERVERIICGIGQRLK